MVGLAGGRKTGRGTREGQESGWSGADGREGGFGVLFFWAGREQEDGPFCDDGSLVSGRRGGNLSGMGSKHQGEARDSFGNPSSELSSWWILSFQT